MLYPHINQGGDGVEVKNWGKKVSLILKTNLITRNKYNEIVQLIINIDLKHFKILI